MLQTQLTVPLKEPGEKETLDLSVIVMCIDFLLILPFFLTSCKLFRFYWGGLAPKPLESSPMPTTHYLIYYHHLVMLLL